MKILVAFCATARDFLLSCNNHVYSAIVMRYLCVSMAFAHRFLSYQKVDMVMGSLMHTVARAVAHWLMYCAGDPVKAASVGLSSGRDMVKDHFKVQLSHPPLLQTGWCLSCLHVYNMC